MKRLGSLLALLLALALVTGDAYAAQLKLVGGLSISSRSFSRCDDAVTVTPWNGNKTDHVTVAGIDLAACKGASLEVWILRSNLKVLKFHSRLEVITADHHSLGGDSFTSLGKDKLVVMIDNWPVSATLAGPQPQVNYCEALDAFGRPDANGYCTIDARTVNQWVDRGQHRANGSITVKSSSTRVSMVVDLADQNLWSGWTPAVITGGGGFSVAASGACDSTTVELVGDLAVSNPSFYFELFESAADAPAGSMQVCPPPTVDSSRYSISGPTAPGEGNPSYVCISRTVTRTRAGGPTNAPWNAEIDLGTAAAVIANAGMHVTGVNLTGDGAAQYLSANHYLFSSKNSGLVLGAAATLQACLSGAR